MYFSFFTNVYSDELIPENTFNNEPGNVLDLAWKNPVTITRTNQQYFALLRRDDLTQMVKVITLSKKVLEILDIAYKLRLGEDVNSQHPFVWLKVFDSDELGEFITEILNAFQDLSSGINDWDLLDAVIHEWQESAIAIQNQEVVSAFLSEDFDEVLLTKPRL
jgi:hypothetical protein